MVRLKREPRDTVRLPEAGKGELDDEMLPARGRPVRQKDTGGDEPDPGAEHGDVSVADALERIGMKARKKDEEAR